MCFRSWICYIVVKGLIYVAFDRLFFFFFFFFSPLTLMIFYFILFQAEYGGHIISLVSGVHISQSGALITFLVERLLASSYLVVTRAACALATRRLQLLLAMPPGQVSLQLPLEDITKVLKYMKENKLEKRYQ